MFTYQHSPAFTHRVTKTPRTAFAPSGVLTSTGPMKSATSGRYPFKLFCNSSMSLHQSYSPVCCSFKAFFRPLRQFIDNRIIRKGFRNFQRSAIAAQSVVSLHHTHDCLLYHVIVKVFGVDSRLCVVEGTVEPAEAQVDFCPVKTRDIRVEATFDAVGVADRGQPSIVLS